MIKMRYKLKKQKSKYKDKDHLLLSNKYNKNIKMNNKQYKKMTKRQNNKILGGIH